MFTQPPWCLGEVTTFASAVDDKVCGLTVALAGHLGLAIRQQLHIAIEDNCGRFLDAPIALWQGSLGLLSHRSHRITPCLTYRVVAIVVGPGVAFPIVGCY